MYVAESSVGHVQSDVKTEKSTSGKFAPDGGLKTESVKTKRQAFSSFGKSQQKMQAAKVEPSSAALKFLQDNDLLKTEKTIAANISGEILGRKIFAHEAPGAHCHASFGTYYTSTGAITQSVCVNNYSGTWFPASTKPFVKNPAVVNN